MKPIWIAGLSAAFLIALPLSAQPVIGAKSGIVNYIEGKVFLGDQVLELQPAQFPEIKENTVVRTGEGRAEILLTPGIVLRMGENSSFKLITNRLIDTRLELLGGSAVVDAMDVTKDTNVTVVFKESTVTFSKAGIYRFDTEPGRMKVFKGSADVRSGTSMVTVQSGKMLNFTGTVAVAEKFNGDQTDLLTVNATAGYTGDPGLSRADLLKHSQFQDMRVHVFAKHSSSLWVEIAQFDVPRQILAQ